MKFSELKCKEVIDCKDGKRLGYVVDLEFCPKDGCILELFVAGCHGCFQKPLIRKIPYENVLKIGPDLIVVKLPGKKP